MALRTLLSTSSLALAGLSAAALLTAGVVFATNSETQLRDSFSVALNGVPSAAQQVAKSIPISGSEEFWLTSMRSDGSLPVTRTVAVGDRIALSFGGQDRKLEVAAVSEFAPAITEIDTRGQSRFVLVTARDSSNKGAPPIRFVMEVEHATAPGVAAKTARTL